MASSRYSKLISELQDLLESPPTDEKLCQALSTALYQASLHLESELDSVRRISHSPLELVAAKIGMDLGIFDILSLGENRSINELAERTGAEKDFLARILRYLASSGVVAQCTQTTYAATRITHALKNEGLKAGIQHHFEVEMPVWSVAPSFFASTSYRCPPSPTQTAFQQAHETSLPAFEWGSTKPKIMHDFAVFMTAQREGEASWLSAFRPEEILGKQSEVDDNERTLFVDVGGGVGHQCRELESWLPSTWKVWGNIVFQDLPEVISMAKATPAQVDAMVHDIFTRQPIQYARFYYLRNILHDHPDASCDIILGHIKAAMGPGSVLLVDELVLPPKVEGASRAAQTAAALDIVVMAALAGRERTREDWEILFNNVGLGIREIRTYDGLGHSVLIMERVEEER